MIHRLKIYILFFFSLLLVACGEKEFYYPNLITEMVCLNTNTEGIGNQFMTDEGKVWYLSENSQPDNLTADSTYRIICRYAPLAANENGKAEVQAYSMSSVIAPLPKPEREYEHIITDPVNLQSIWRRGDYLNMVLQVMVKDKNHHLSFIEDGLFTNLNGTRTLTLKLYHDSCGDIEGFEQTYYLSVPLWHYQDRLEKGDQIEFHLNTYKEGMTYRTFTY